MTLTTNGSDFLITFGLNFVIFLVGLFCFCIVRKWYPDVFFPRSEQDAGIFFYLSFKPITK